MATVILSIGVLALVSTVLTTTKFSTKATTNDAAYSIARQRLALMQDGELLVRPSYTDSVIRDHRKYYTYDVVDTVDSLLPLRLTIEVSWKTPDPKSISLSGYLNREICPDTGVTTPPDSITVSNYTIPDGSPANTYIGELRVYDPDSSDLHMFLYEDSVYDNELFKVEKGKLYTADVMTLGVKILEIGVSDCAGNEDKYKLNINVTTVDSVPNIPDQIFNTNENIPEATSIGTVYASPSGVTFNILSQTPTSPFSIGTNDGILTLGSSELSYESTDTITMQIIATNVSWHDTGKVIVTINDVNETPSTLTYTGGTTVDEGTAVGTALGRFATTDPDNGDSHSYTLTGSAFQYFTLDPILGETLKVRLDPIVPGTYSADVTSTDGGGLSITESFSITVNDTGSGSSSDCGSYTAFSSGTSYSSNAEVYYDSYIYRAKWWTEDTPSLVATSWNFIGTCSGLAECDDFTPYHQSITFEGGHYTNYKSTIYRAGAWVKGTKPPKSPWQEVVGCN